MELHSGRFSSLVMEHTPTNTRVRLLVQVEPLSFSESTWDESIPFWESDKTRMESFLSLL